MDEPTLHQFCAACLGSPDPGLRQVDGVGGGTVTTSKVAVVGPPTRTGATVDYDYFQVRVRDGRVDRNVTCGNLTSAVARFSVEIGLAEPDRIVLHDTNTHGLVSVSLNSDPRPTTRPIKARVSFLDPSGRVSGTLLPTASVVNEVKIRTKRVRVTLIDIINPTVIVDAGSLGVTQPLPRTQIEADLELMASLEEIRRWGAVHLGLAATTESAGEESPFLPFVGLAFPQLADLAENVVRLPVRLLSGGTAHHALPLGAALATAASATIPGSAGHAGATGQLIELLHPSGSLSVEVGTTSIDPPAISAVSVELTTRRIMEGHIIVP